jgi:SPP1 family predicted phage head-tail adaptor
MPDIKHMQLYHGWYGELEYSSVDKYATEQRADSQIDMRIRILYNQQVTSKDVVGIDGDKYEITRVYHGKDKETLAQITDLTLTRLA